MTKPIRSLSAQNRRDNQVAQLTKQRDQRIDDAKRIRAGKLTLDQKKLAIGASVAAGLLITYGAYKLHDSGDMNRLMLKGRAAITGRSSPWVRNNALSKKMTEDEIMKNIVSKINPNYGAFGTKMNCRRATFAYEMRRRGFDVAATTSRTGTNQNAIHLFNALDPKSDLPVGFLGQMRALAKEAADDKGFPIVTNLVNHGPMGMNRINLDNLSEAGLGLGKANTIFNALAGQPDGARGELGVAWKMGSGHSMAWEIVGGVPKIFDAQTGEAFGNAGLFAKLAENVKSADFTRLDDIELNTDFLMRWVKNA